MSTQKNGKLLQGKDLISIGIFSAIYFVLNFICMLLSGLHPVIWILMPALIALGHGNPVSFNVRKGTEIWRSAFDGHGDRTFVFCDRSVYGYFTWHLFSGVSAWRTDPFSWRI